MDPTTDERRARFRACFRAHWIAVLKYLRRRGAGEQAEDLAAEVFATAWRRWGDVPDPPLPWLLGTARKLLANQRRRGSLDGLPVDLSVADLTAAGAEERDALRRLVAALKRLPEPQRELLLLVAWDGLPVVEAAQAAGCSPVTARVRLHRARQRLRREFAGDGAAPMYTEMLEMNSNG